MGGGASREQTALAATRGRNLTAPWLAGKCNFPTIIKKIQTPIYSNSQTPIKKIVAHLNGDEGGDDNQDGKTAHGFGKPQIGCSGPPP